MSIIAILDQNFNITNINDNFSTFLLPKKVAIGLNFCEIFQNDDKEEVMCLLKNTKKNGMETFEREIMRFGCGTSDFPHLSKYEWTVVKNINGYTAITLDSESICENTTTNTNLEEVNDYLHKAPIALHWLSPTGVVLWANDTEISAIGYTREEYIGQNIIKFCPDSVDDCIKFMESLNSGKTLHNIPIKLRKKNGEIQHLLIDSNVSCKGDGSFNHTRCFVRDDTGRTKRDARYNSIIEDQIRLFQEKKKYLDTILKILRKPVDEISTILKNSHFYEEDNMGQVYHQTKILSGIIKGISKSIKFDEGYTLEITPTENNLSQLISKFIYHQKQLLKTHIDLYLNFDSLLVKVDVKILRIVLLELLAHAVSRTVEGGKIELYIILQENDNFAFSVNDFGPELNEKVVEKIFHNYWLNCTDSNYSNINLNLAFNYIECIGSKLSVTSTKEKTKFEFKLNLPVIDVMEKIETGTQNSDVSDFSDLTDFSETGDFKWISLLDDLETPKHNNDEFEIGLDNSPKHILVVEDNSICQKICKRFIEMLGHSCDVANNGEIAVDMVKNMGDVNIYDMVIMDIVMPIMDGFESSIKIKNVFPKLPIVALSAEESCYPKIKQSGIISYMSKPPKIDDIEWHIKNYAI